MTGIGYNKAVLQGGQQARAEVASPTCGRCRPTKVTFLTEKRDTFGLGLLKLGKSADPATTTADDLQAVHDDIKPLVDGGLIFTGNDVPPGLRAPRRPGRR